MPITREGIHGYRFRSLTSVPRDVFVYTPLVYPYFADFPKAFTDYFGFRDTATGLVWVNEWSLLHVVRNNLELFIYGPPGLQDTDWEKTNCYISQMELIETLLKDVRSDLKYGDVRMRLNLIVDSNGTARFAKQDFRMLPLVKLGDVPMINEHRLHTKKWQPYLQTKWGLLDGVTEVEVLYAWDFLTSELLAYATVAVEDLANLDLVAPLLGCLVDDHLRMVGLVFQVEPGERQLSASDSCLILEAFAALEAVGLCMYATEADELKFDDYYAPWKVFDPDGIVVANDKIRFVNNMLFSWCYVQRVGQSPEICNDEALLSEVKRYHWNVAQRVVQAGIHNDHEVYPNLKFDLVFYESLTVILTPESPLDDVFEMMLGKTMRSYERTSAGKRRQRIAGAKGQKLEKEQDHTNTSLKKKLRAQGFAAWSGAPVKPHAKGEDDVVGHKTGHHFPTRRTQPRLSRTGSTRWPLCETVWTDTQQNSEGCRAWIEEVTDEVSIEAGVSSLQKETGTEQTGEA